MRRVTGVIRTCPNCRSVISTQATQARPLRKTATVTRGLAAILVALALVAPAAGSRPRRRAVPARSIRRDGRDRPRRPGRRPDCHARERAQHAPHRRGRELAARRHARRATPLIELDRGGPPDTLVVLPPEGRSENTRYPIAVAPGPRGVLTSDSTRIVGLVSLADVAHGRLEVVEVDDPVATLERLERRIERNDDLRLSLSVLAGALAYVAAVFAPALRSAGRPSRARRQPLARRLVGRRAPRRSPLPCSRSASRAQPSSRRYLLVARARPGGGRALALRPFPGRTLLRRLEPARDDAARAGAARGVAPRPARDRGRRARASSPWRGTASAPTAAGCSSCSRDMRRCSRTRSARASVRRTSPPRQWQSSSPGSRSSAWTRPSGLRAT